MSEKAIRVAIEGVLAIICQENFIQNVTETSDLLDLVMDELLSNVCHNGKDYDLFNKIATHKIMFDNDCEPGSATAASTSLLNTLEIKDKVFSLPIRD